MNENESGESQVVDTKVSDVGAPSNTDNKGQYEENAVDSFEQGEIDAILGKSERISESDGKDDDIVKELERAGGKKDGKAEGKEDAGDKERVNKEVNKEEGKEVKVDASEDPTIAAMRAEILRLTEMVKGTAQPAKSEKVEGEGEKKEGEGEKKAITKPAVKAEPLTIDNIGIEISDETYDKMFEDKGVLKGVLSNVVQKTAEKTAERIYMGLPTVINNMVRMQVGLSIKTNDMYTANPDIKPYGKMVGMVANDLVAQHPDWNEDKIFTETPIEVRKRLGLAVKGKRKDEIEVRGRPIFANRGSGVRPVEKGGETERSGVEGEIQDMINMK